MKQQKIFRSRISVLIAGFVLVAFIGAVIPMFETKDYQGLWGLGLPLLFVGLLLGGIRYVISGDELYVKIWFIPYLRAKIKDINLLERSYNPLSSPAVSLKRLKISFSKGWFWLISPAKERLFIDELKAINTNICIKVPEKKGIWRIQDWDI